VRRTVEWNGAARGSWCLGLFWREPMEEDEMALAAAWTDARLYWLEALIVIFWIVEIAAGVGWRRLSALEVQEQADVAGGTTFGRMPQAEIANLMQAFWEDVLKEAADELEAIDAAGAPAR